MFERARATVLEGAASRRALPDSPCPHHARISRIPESAARLVVRLVLSHLINRATSQQASRCVPPASPIELHLGSTAMQRLVTLCEREFEQRDGKAMAL
jgi:hypothetical protein